MAIYTREKLPEVLAQATKKPSQVFLLFGDRYLCRNAVEQLERALLHTGNGAVHLIDGDQEDSAVTFSKLRTFSLLPGRQIYRVTDTRLFLSRKVAENIWKRACTAHAEAKPEQASRALLAFLQSGGIDPHDPQAPDNALVDMSAAEWKQSFGFPHPDGDLSWTRAYLNTDSTKGSNSAPVSPSDPGEMLAAALAAGIPSNNFLVLVAEDVDKRKKLFKLLKKDQSVIDLSVEGGAGAKAQKEQRGVLQELVRQTLAEQGKTMAPGLLDLLLERVGFHPVAVVMELRKVISYIAEQQQITRNDLDLLVGRTRQEALFELTTAISKGDREQALLIADRLQGNGIHPLAVMATLRNFVRGLLLCRALLELPEVRYQATMSAAVFQQTCLPFLKEREQWKKELGGHPYALYMQFKMAAGFPLPVLTTWMHHLLRAEMRLKGSPVVAATILQHLILSMLAR